MNVYLHFLRKSWLFLLLCLGVDPAERRVVHRAEGQPAPAAVCGEAGEDPEIYDQREGAHPAGSQPHLGGAGGQTRGHCQERARPAGQARLGLLTRAARPSL